MNKFFLFGAISLSVLLGDSALGASTSLVISEFRLRGPNGANDEFIEIYNVSGAAFTVASSSGTGFGIAASDGVLRATIPNGTVIPNHGHFLATNSMGYSLSNYPSGNGVTATGNATYTADIPDNAGIALFNTNLPVNFALANRLDAVGSTSEANTLYKEGTGYPALTPFPIEYSFFRKYPGTATNGSVPDDMACRVRTGANPVDTDNNAADFTFVDINGTSAGAGQRLGAPGPQNLSSPVQGVSAVASRTEVVPIDATVSSGVSPNWVRDFTSDPANNSTFGTLDLRRTYTNETGANITRLRFRIIEINTFPSPSGFADLRPRTSADVVVTTSAGTVTARGTTLEVPPMQPNGSGINGSLSVGTVTALAPLANGASVSVRFLLGIQQTGKFHFGVTVEASPTEPGFTWEILGDTDNGITNDCTTDPTSVVLAATPNPSTFGAAVTLTADVTPTAATGNIVFKDGTTVLGTVPLVTGHATLAVSTLTVGTHSLTAAYSGAALWAASVSPAVLQVVNKATTATTVASSLNPSTASAAVTFTATVAPATATGIVTFKDGATVLGTGTLAAGQASFTTGALVAGAHSITAAYGGDVNNAVSVSPALNQVVKATTTTALASSLNPANFGASITLTATVAPGSATGTVTFMDGATVLGTSALTGGQATFTSTTLTAGSHVLTAAYGGDANNVASVSPALNQVVKATTTTTVASSLNPAGPGVAITITATVAPSTATGTITFKDGTTVLGTGVLAGGQATFSSTAFTAGVHVITAEYGGDANDVASVSTALNQVVKATTTTMLASSLNPSIFGDTVTLTATVAPISATGTVTFKDGTVVIGTSALGGGQASFSSAVLARGTHALTAEYSGDTNNVASVSAALSQLVKATTTTLVASSLNPSVRGDIVTFTATVVPSSATGTITLKDGTTVLGMDALTGGQTTFSTAALTAGTHVITAEYSGDANDVASVSPALSQVVQPPVVSGTGGATGAGGSLGVGGATGTGGMVADGGSDVRAPGAGGSGAGGARVDAAADRPASGSSGGCGCTTAGGAPFTNGSLLLIAGILILGRRKRSRR